MSNDVVAIAHGGDVNDVAEVGHIMLSKPPQDYPFSTFNEWDSHADTEGYAALSGLSR